MGNSFKKIVEGLMSDCVDENGEPMIKKGYGCPNCGDKVLGPLIYCCVYCQAVFEKKERGEKNV